MVELSLSTALMIYLMLTLGTLLFLWAGRHCRRRKTKIIYVEEEITLCEYCQYCYLKDIATPLSRCPQCKSLNQ